MLFGVTGACRCDELVQLSVNDIKDLGDLILINTPITKNKKHRSFTIIGDFYLNLYRKYALLRPENMPSKRFFVKYQNGKCHRVVMGIHKISSVPKEVATFLKLLNPHEYTGHCLRRTSATILVDSGADITALKRHGGWKSGSVAEGYVEESLKNKKDMAMKILKPTESSKPDTSAQVTYNESEYNYQDKDSSSAGNDELLIKEIKNISSNGCRNDGSVNVQTKSASSALNINNCTIQRCTFNIYVNK